MSQQALQNYTTVSLKYKQWFRPLDVTSNSALEAASCHESASEKTPAECVLERLTRVRLEDFWPFNPEVIKKNQMLAILSATSEAVEDNDRALKQMVRPQPS